MERTSLFRFPYGVFLMVRLEYVLLTRNELEAQILRVLEGELEYQRQRWRQEAAAIQRIGRAVPPEPSGWVRLSQAQLLSRLYKFDTAKVGGARQPLSMSKTTLRRALKRLTERGYVQVRQEPGDPLGRARYQLQVEAIQQALDALPHMAKPHQFFWQEEMSESVDGFSVHDGDAFSHKGGPPFQNDNASFQNGGTPLPQWRPYKKEKKEEEREKQEPKEAASVQTTHQTERTERESAAAVYLLDDGLGVQAPSGRTSTSMKRSSLSAAPGVEGDQGKQAPLSPRVAPPVVTAAEVQQETVPVPGMAGKALPASTIQPAEAEASEIGSPGSTVLHARSVEAEAVVTLVERLRGKGYSREQRGHELRAATRLLTLEPKVSLQEIETAWTHGSDAYWRRTHQGEQVHVHDLVHRDSHGRYRVHAFLEHLKQQKLRLRVPVERSCPSQVQEQIPYAVMARQRAAAVAKGREQPACVSQPGEQPLMRGEMRGEEPQHSSGLTQRQAQQLATILAQQAASLGLHLESAAQPTECGWQVCLRWKTPASEAREVLVSKAVEGLRLIKGMSPREAQQRRSA